MKLSVIIVNYNVKYFLEQCLHSVRRAARDVEVEILVVDNNSVDGSVKMINEKFPEISLIVNNENKGFSVANNQAIRQAKGEYLLLLNPDTLVEDDTFGKIISFMDSHPDAGGLTVKMVDGKGRFLPESKRSLPTPEVAFYKLFGLSRLFPKSRRFGQYHLTYLDNDKISQIGVLSGAFMLIRRSVLDKIGLLDESFFMYGEDIDLSYRITKAGFKNYYFPEARIIHYKGESTRKTSINYVITFYQAMITFARKHYTQKNARLLAFMIHIAIWFRAGLAITWRFARNIFLPVTDAVVMFFGFLFLKNYWEATIKYVEGGSYPIEFIAIAVPAYILVWLLVVYFTGGYDRPFKLMKLFQGLFFGTVTILVIYGLLSEEYRFSRALIILGAFWGLLSMTATRFLLQFTGHKDFKLEGSERKRYVIVGEADECERVAELLRKTDASTSFIGLVYPGNPVPDSTVFLGNLRQLRDIINIYQINEVIFCARDIASQNIIDTMTGLNGIKIDYKIAPPESMFVIGSSSINTTGDLYMVEINNIARQSNRRSKRLFDVAASVMMLLLWPFGAFVTRKPGNLLINTLMVLVGLRTWVGYSIPDKHIQVKLPSIRKGILSPADSIKEHLLTNEDLMRLNILYARNYRVVNDINTLVKGFARTGC